jgi:hypothetical protein
VDIRSEAWLNLLWEYINGKNFAVHAEKLDMVIGYTFEHISEWHSY